MSDLVGNHIVGFPTRRLIYILPNRLLCRLQLGLNLLVHIFKAGSKKIQTQ